ncbi:MAG: alpha/beta hydrolase-fold protein [Gammaproteobacteria bacterium]
MKPSALFGILAFVPSVLFAEGTISSGIIESSALGVSKSFNIYLPTGYSSGDLRYPVIYLVHGWGVNEDTWSSPGLEVQKVADEMNLQAIIVMPDGDRGVYVNSATPANFDECMNEASPTRNAREPRQEFCVRTSNYESYMVEEIVPYIDGTYRTISTRQARSITGESAGGLAAFHLALRHKDLFSSVAAHSGGVSMLYLPREDAMLTNIEHRPGFEEWEAVFGLNIEGWRQYDPYSLLDSLQPNELAIYFDSGTEDEFGFYQMALHFERRLKELGLEHTFVSVPGGKHDVSFFGSRIPFSLEFHVGQFEKAGVYPEP